MAQSLYMIGIYKNNGSGLGSSMSKVSWVYMITPYFGAALAAGVFYVHNYIANVPAKQHEPMEFMDESRHTHQQDQK